MIPIANDPKVGLVRNKELILALCKAFDQGDEILALPLATALRVLLHDTRKSTSILQLVGLKENSIFLSTTQFCSKEQVNLGLVRQINVGIHDGIGGEAKYWALCDERYFRSPSGKHTKLSFQCWWEEIVFRNFHHGLSRKDIVLAVANKDGGAHFDKEVEARYDAFRQTWSGGSSLVGIHSREHRGYDNIPSFPAIRQIAYEVLKSEVHNVS
jgi:hypothetical protein